MEEEKEVRYLYTMQDVYEELMKHIKQQNRTALVIIIWMWIITIALLIEQFQ